MNSSRCHQNPALERSLASRNLASRCGRAVLAAILLAGGGSTVGADSREPSPAHVMHHATTLAASASNAEQLFAVAESTYAELFPSHPSTLQAAPFSYRYYPQSGVYLGVVVETNPSYRIDGVYVLGGPFGNAAVYVGQVTDFVPSSTGNGNGCSNLRLQHLAGTQYSVTMLWSGSVKGTIRYDTIVGNEVTFEGERATETVLHVTGEGSELEIKSYSRRLNELEMVSFGSINTDLIESSPTGPRSVSRLVYQPPPVSRLNALAPGEEVHTTETGTVTTTIRLANGQFRTSSMPYLPDQYDRFVGFESVTVPAGTFKACRFETRLPTAPDVLITSWSLHDHGVELKKVETLGGRMVSTNEAVSLVLGGKRARPAGMDLLFLQAIRRATQVHKVPQ